MTKFVLNLANFYAAVESELNPSLAGKAFAVSNGAVIVGISSETRFVDSRLKPGMPEPLVRERFAGIAIVAGDVSRYLDYSRVIAHSLENLAFRITETRPGCYALDIAGCPLARCDAGSAAEMVVEAVPDKRFRGGRANALPLAQIASAAAAVNTVRDVPLGGEEDFIASLPPTMLPAMKDYGGVFREMGIRTVGDIRRIPPQVLKQLFGASAGKIHRWSGGEFDDIPQVKERIDREIRLSNPGASPDPALKQAVTEVVAELLERGLNGESLLLSLRYTDKVTISRRLKLVPTRDEVNLQKAAAFLLSQIWKRRTGIESIRLETAAVPENGQISFLEDGRRSRVARSVNKVRKTYGDTALCYALAL